MSDRNISLLVFLFLKAFSRIFTDGAGALEMGVVCLDIMILHFFVSAVVGSGEAALNFIILKRVKTAPRAN